MSASTAEQEAFFAMARQELAKAEAAAKAAHASATYWRDRLSWASPMEEPEREPGRLSPRDEDLARAAMKWGAPPSQPDLSPDQQSRA